jgi:putative transcriptional regulator
MKPSSGKILIAEPFMQDQHFRGSVVFLCDHRQEGTFGLILNKPSKINVCDAVEDFPAIDSLLYYGGPVQPNTLHYLHRRGDLFDDCTEVKPGIYWGGDYEKLRFCIETSQISPSEIRFFSGYSGWEEDQLKTEMRDNSWIVTEGELEHIFHENPGELWRTVLRSMGDRYRVISNFPENPSLN